MRSHRFSALAAGLLLLARSGPASAQALSDKELDLVRGGYLSAAGITFGFGATVTTLVNGELALQSTFTLTNGGATLSQQGGPSTTLQPLTPASAQAAGLSGLQGYGVLASDPSGVSAIVHSLTADQVLNVVVNTANGRTITQNTAVTLTLPNFPELQRNLAAQTTSANLLSAVSVGALGAVRH